MMFCVDGVSSLLDWKFGWIFLNSWPPCSGLGMPVDQEKLAKLAASVRTGGKGSVRRKKKAVHKTATTGSEFRFEQYVLVRMCQYEGF